MNFEARKPDEEKDLRQNVASPSETPRSRRITLVRLVQWSLGGLFIYMGLSKALQPVEFLKLVRQYGVVESHVGLNLIAAVLPWFEVFCGAVLICGWAVRGTALALVVLLTGFSVVVLSRAWSLHEAQAIPFCAVRFDCGCGAGEVLICGKLLENVVLIVLSVFLVMRERGR